MVLVKWGIIFELKNWCSWHTSRSKGSNWALGCIIVLKSPDDSDRMRALFIMKLRAKVLDLVNLLDPIIPRSSGEKIFEILMSSLDI